jgi:hypothetical protein
MSHADQEWTEALPLILLGIRAAFKEDLHASVAELVYGEPLRIPGELLTPSANAVDPALLITEVRQRMARLRPVPAARHASPATFVHSHLEKCTHVFLRQDATRRALAPHTASPTKSCHGETRHCSYSYVGDLSPCPPTGSSQRTYFTRTTMRTTRTHQPQQPPP